MATAVSYSKTGAKHETDVKLSKDVFAAEANHELVGLAYRAYLANGRRAKASTLTRGLVSGGGRKPHKQKGTGRARAGSTRMPQWKGGGVVFGPLGVENYTINMPVKMKRAAIRQALSLRATAGNIVVLDSFEAPEGKVKPTIELMKKLGLTGTILLAVAEKNSLTERATRNVAGLKAVSATYLNVYEVMNADSIVITKDALAAIDGWLGDKQ